MISLTRYTFFLHLLLFPFISSAQDISYARTVVDTLASEAMKGRGYVEDGDRLAAAYISSQFAEIGLKSYGKSYLQQFTTSVNTFPSRMELLINGQQLKPGEDFLIDPGSPGLDGSYETVHLSAAEMLNGEQLLEKLGNARGRFLIIAPYDAKDYSKEEQKRLSEVAGFLRYSPENPAVGTLFLTKGKLTWSGSTQVNATPSFTVAYDSAFQEIKQVRLKVKNKFVKKYKTQNVVGYLEGKSADSLIVLTAHYDHLGMMGAEATFTGANDNASGVAMLLNLAKYYQQNTPEYTMVFIAFGAEELGLLGSQYFVENPPFDLQKIVFLLNFDIAGTGDEGIQVVNGAVYKEKFDLLKQINEQQKLLPQVKIRGEACNSDHCMFHMKGVPSFFIYTLGGIQAYHDVYDRAETLPLTEFEDYLQLITAFVDRL